MYFILLQDNKNSLAEGKCCGRSVELSLFLLFGNPNSRLVESHYYPIADGLKKVVIEVLFVCVSIEFLTTLTQCLSNILVTAVVIQFLFSPINLYFWYKYMS